MHVKEIEALPPELVGSSWLGPVLESGWVLSVQASPWGSLSRRQVASGPLCQQCAASLEWRGGGNGRRMVDLCYRAAHIFPRNSGVEALAPHCSGTQR